MIKRTLQSIETFAATAQHHALPVTTPASAGERIIGFTMGVHPQSTRDLIFPLPAIKRNQHVICYSGYGMSLVNVLADMVNNMKIIDVNQILTRSWEFIIACGEAIPETVKVTHRGGTLGEDQSDLILTFVRRDNGAAYTISVQDALSHLSLVSEELTKTKEPDYTQFGSMPLVLFTPALSSIPITVQVPHLGHLLTRVTNAPTPKVASTVPYHMYGMYFIPGASRQAYTVRAPGLSTNTIAWSMLDVQFLRAGMVLNLGFWQTEMLSYTTGVGGLNLPAHSLWALTRSSPEAILTKIWNLRFDPHELVGGIGRFDLMNAAIGVLLTRDLLRRQKGDMNTSDILMNRPEYANTIDTMGGVSLLHMATSPMSRSVYQLLDRYHEEVQKFISLMVGRIKKRRVQPQMLTSTGVDIWQSLDHANLASAKVLALDDQPIRWAENIFPMENEINFGPINVEPWFTVNLGQSFYLTDDQQRHIPVRSNLDQLFFTNRTDWNKSNVLQCSVKEANLSYSWREGLEIKQANHFAPGTYLKDKELILTSTPLAEKDGYSWIVPARYKSYLKDPLISAIGSTELR